MAEHVETMLREQLAGRRAQLSAVLLRPAVPARIRSLLDEVDEALVRMDEGQYGLCDACHEPIETDRLLADPLVRLCLDHLTPSQQTDLERDLELAVRIQRGLLPPPRLDAGPWAMAYEYRPARIVSGDYCDALPGQHGDWYFLLGDVAGKGVAASMVMTQLHAMFRAIIPAGLPLQQIVGRASTLFCESTLPTHYATLLSLRAWPDGRVEVCSAGHLPALHVRSGGVERIESSGLPVGMFCSADYATRTIVLDPGETLVLYTDGLSETEDADGSEFGIDRIAGTCLAHAGRTPAEMVARTLADIDWFRSGPVADDLTMMAISRIAP